MIDRLVRRGRLLVDEVRAGGAKAAATDVRGWIWSEREAIGFRFDATRPGDPPKAKVELAARPLDADIAPLVFNVPHLSPTDQLFLDRRRNIFEAGFDGGWVAVDPDGQPAYLQWLIPSHQTEKIREFFGPIFPRFDAETLLVEGAWIPPDFRRLKVMGEGLALVSEAATAANGARYAQCYPAADNKGAALGTRSAGYEVVEKRIERWRLARRTVEFAPANESDFSVFSR